MFNQSVIMFEAVLTCVVACMLTRAGAIQESKEVLRTPATFSSPNFPQPYPNNQIYEWEIIAERGIRVSLKFNKFSIENDVNCTKDAVTIYDWKDEKYEEIAKLCGANLPPVYKSTYNKLKVVLSTNEDTNLSGFQAMWDATCGGEYLATEKKQFLYSPGYPNYWPNMSCLYKIKVPDEDEDIILKGIFEIKNFELEDKRPSDILCFNDYLSLVSGRPYLFKEIHERHCGKKVIPADYFERDLDIHFKSNAVIEKTGFEMSFSLYTCGGRVTEPTTITASQLKRYPNSMLCNWTIEAPENKKVVVKFAYLNLNVAALCGKYQDYIKLYDGLSPDQEKQLAAICGNTNAPIIVPASGNLMTFQFHSNRDGKGFLAEILFIDPEPASCGGIINMTYFTSFTLKSPQNVSNSGGQLFCTWNILAPQDYVIKVKMTSFSFPECNKQSNKNYLEIRDGIVPDSLLLGSYCGQSLPAEVISSTNRLSVRMFSVPSSEFSATLTVEEAVCKPTVIQVSHNLTRIQSLGYESGSLPRGINCAYEFQATSSPLHLIIRNLDVQPSTTPTMCNKDKIVIGQRSWQNMLGKDYTTKNGEFFNVKVGSLFRKYNIYENVNLTHQYEFCGSHDIIELYLPESFMLNLITSPESVSRSYKGFEIDVLVPKYCSYKNYSEPYGRIIVDFGEAPPNDCYTLITAPEGYTISVYFISYAPYFTESSDVEYMDIYDGATTASKKIISTKGQTFKLYDVVQPVFSTGRYLLLHIIRTQYREATFDLNYVTTNKGQGCGGYLFGDQGVVTSPFYPNRYNEDKICEWELETPPGTRLLLSFKEFDVYGNSYVKVMNRAGQVVLTLNYYTSEEEYISDDNYVRFVFETTSHAGDGSKWIALFASVSSN